MVTIKYNGNISNNFIQYLVGLKPIRLSEDDLVFTNSDDTIRIEKKLI
jgi:hypothetical protein